MAKEPAEMTLARRGFASSPLLAAKVSSTAGTDSSSLHSHFCLRKADVGLVFWKSYQHKPRNPAGINSNYYDYYQHGSTVIWSKLPQKPSSLFSVCHYLWHKQWDPPTHFCHISRQMDWSLEENTLGLNLFSLASNENLQELQVQVQKAGKANWLQGKIYSISTAPMWLTKGTPPCHCRYALQECLSLRYLRNLAFSSFSEECSSQFRENTGKKATLQATKAVHLVLALFRIPECSDLLCARGQMTPWRCLWT